MGAVAGREYFKGHGQQGVPCQDGRSLVKSDMTGRLSPPEIIVVHGGQIVMDQRVGMNHFQGTGGGKGLFRGTADSLGTGQAKDGPESFSSGHQRIGHGLHESAWQGCSGETRLQVSVNDLSLRFQIDG